MKIEVLGTGCAKCRKLHAEAEKAVASAGVSAVVEKVEDLEGIMRYGVALTPALVIDGEVKSVGTVPRASRIEAWIRAAAGSEGNR